MALDLDERPGHRKHKPKRPKLGRADLDLVIEHATPAYRPIIATAAALGTRLGETLGIAWRHVDFDNGLVEIEQQANAKRKIARLKTQTAYRKIEAPSWLMSALAEVKIGRKEILRAGRSRLLHLDR